MTWRSGGAMTALMARAINPNLLQTIEGQPTLVHAGPFANIAIGQSSIIADKVGLKLADYHVTESGFGADIGFEKFWNLKCRFSGLTPNVSVIVATIRALKMHGGGPAVAPGRPLDAAYTESHPDLVEKGIQNLVAHIETVRKAGVNPVVCLNHFYTDSDDEVAVVRQAAEAAGARFAVSKHWELGGEGAEDFAHVVVEACEEKPDFKFLYADQDPLKTKIEKIAIEVYGADGVTYSPTAEQKIKKVEADAELKPDGRLHGQDPPEPLPRPGTQGPAQGMDSAHPGRPDLPGRRFRGAGGGRHQAHARNRFRRRLPADRRGSGDGEGGGALLEVPFSPHLHQTARVAEMAPRAAGVCASWHTTERLPPVSR